MSSTCVTCGSGITTLYAQMIFIGEDLLIVFEGGDQPHIGSCSFRNFDSSQLSKLWITKGSHKDYHVSEIIATKLSTFFGHSLIIVGGIHIESITEDQINKVLENAHELARKMKHHLLQKQSN